MRSHDLKGMDVSCETLADLENYVEQLKAWNKSINLVSKKSLDEIWERHIYDSYQLLKHIPQNSKCLVDFGSGGGLPAIVLSICAKHAGAPVRFTLIESDKRKAVFLRQVGVLLDLGLAVCGQRIEDVVLDETDVITARALAPLSGLFAYSQPFLSERTVCLFPKGKNWRKEVQFARKGWYFDMAVHPNESDPTGVILEIRNIKKVT